jgi:transposase, mutator family
MKSKIKSRTMKLTAEQKSEIISEMASSEAGFNELMRVLLDSFSKQERALFLEEHKGEQGNGFRPRRWRGHGCSFQLRIPRTRSGAFQPIILGILAAQESERALLFHESYARGLSCEDIAEVGRRIYGYHYSKQQVQTTGEPAVRGLLRGDPRVACAPTFFSLFGRLHRCHVLQHAS